MYAVFLIFQIKAGLE